MELEPLILGGLTSKKYLCDSESSLQKHLPYHPLDVELGREI